MSKPETLYWPRISSFALNRKPLIPEPVFLNPKPRIGPVLILKL